jgi:hypothetical protein
MESGQFFPARTTMYQLRFLIGSPRRNAPHIFNHRDYRGQRTQPDPMHPDYMTYVCEPTPSLSSHGVMLLLMENAIQHQPNSRLLPIVELYNEQTGDRLPLQGNEIVLRREDLEAAKRALEANQTTTTEVETKQPAQPQEQPELPEPSTPQEPPAPTLLDRIKEAIAAGNKTAVMLSNELGVSSDAIKDAVAAEGSGLQNKGGWIKPLATE